MRDPKEWATADNVHIDMNPWYWMGDGKVNREHLWRLRYDRTSNFIYENNQPSHAGKKTIYFFKLNRRKNNYLYMLIIAI